MSLAALSLRTEAELLIKGWEIKGPGQDCGHKSVAIELILDMFRMLNS